MKAEALGGGDVSVCRWRRNCFAPSDRVHLEGAARERECVSPQLQAEELLSLCYCWLCPRDGEAEQLQFSSACAVGSIPCEGSSAPLNWGWDSPVWIQHRWKILEANFSKLICEHSEMFEGLCSLICCKSSKGMVQDQGWVLVAPSPHSLLPCVQQ